MLTAQTAPREIYNPEGIAVDSVGNVYVTDAAQTIRKITPVGNNWVVSTIAGGSYGHADGTGTNAGFGAVWGIAADAAGNLYVADDDTIRQLTPVGSNG